MDDIEGKIELPAITVDHLRCHGKAFQSGVHALGRGSIFGQFRHRRLYFLGGRYERGVADFLQL